MSALAAAPVASAFLERWHACVDARDAEGLAAIIHPDCELCSPVVWKPKFGRDLVVHILGGVIATIEGFRYRKEWVDETGLMLMLEFEGTVNGRGLVGLDRITLDAQGRMTRIEVWMRPLNTLIDFATIMNPHVEAFQPRT